VYACHIHHSNEITGFEEVNTLELKVIQGNG